MTLSILHTGLIFAAVLVGCAVPSSGDDRAPLPATEALAEYFAEPVNLPFAEEIQEQKQEDGWHWTEFRYTSLIYQGEPIRIHAVYAVPDTATAQRQAPAILMTHGVFGSIRGDANYWNALSACVKAGFAVLFIDWYPNFARDFHPQNPQEPKRFTTFGKIDYFTPSGGCFKPENDFKDSLDYQVALAAKRGVTWLQARPEVDGTRIGANGCSYGGIFSSMFAGLDHRIVAVNPCVYTAGFGPQEQNYNFLNLHGTALATWQQRFDSQVLLAKRNVEILYTVGARDGTFLLTKAMDIYAAMKGPKHLLIGPQAGHEYWAVDQTVLFFEATLDHRFRWPSIRELHLKNAGGELEASASAPGETLRKVEFFFTALWEIDPDTGPQAIPAGSWKWAAVESRVGPNGQAAARWTPPVMRPINPQERVYEWGTADVRNPAAARLASETAIATAKLQGLVRAFVRVTDTHGAMACSPLSAPVLFSDPPAPAPRVTLVPGSLPTFQAAVRVTTNTVVDLQAEAAAGQPLATLDVLPDRAVGTHGYVLWNWRQQPPAPALVTDGVATPTLRILPPFADAVRTNSFEGPKGRYSCGGLTVFRINGKLDTVGTDGRSWHGAVPPGLGGTDEVTIAAKDERSHLLTVVVPATSRGECNVRVSVSGPTGATATVKYRQTSTADAVLQFRFQGTATLRVQISSQPTADPATVLVGPSAIFLD